MPATASYLPTPSGQWGHDIRAAAARRPSAATPGHRDAAAGTADAAAANAAGDGDDAAAAAAAGNGDATARSSTPATGDGHSATASGYGQA